MVVCSDVNVKLARHTCQWTCSPFPSQSCQETQAARVLVDYYTLKVNKLWQGPWSMDYARLQEDHAWYTASDLSHLTRHNGCRVDTRHRQGAQLN